MSFVHLHSHTHYSLLDGAAKIRQILNRTAELGMEALAITDHGNLFGALEFYTEAMNTGIKPIIGMEAYIAPRERTYRKQLDGEANSYHLVLLAKNETGFRNLIKLSSIAYLEGMYYKPRIDKKVLKQYSEGLIATSACMKGEISYKLRRGMREQAIKAAEEYLDIFGDDFYLEIQDHHIPEEAEIYPKIYQLAKEMGVGVVGTNDNHYLHKGDDEAHDILLCLQTGKNRDDPNRMRYQTTELYLKSPEEMYAILKDRPDAYERTQEINEKIDLHIDFSKQYLPKFPIPQSEGNIESGEYLKKLTYEGARKHYLNLDQSIVDRIEHELTVINKMGFAGYFLITQDFINAAKERDIPVGLGRGSAAGSIVAYSLGITDIDPLRYDLLFERFLNPDRITLPDIDIDFCMERRDEVIDYVKQKYGRQNVAQIITFGTMASRGVVRDVSRILEIPIPKADAIAKMIPMVNAKPMKLKRAFKEIPELKELAGSGDEKIQELIKYAETLEGIARHASVHAAGLIITPDDITNYVPLHKNSDQEITTQWTMGWCESIGLLKMDFLGLRNLTVIQKTEKLINERHEINFKVKDVSLDDEKTYKLFGDGLTVGVFQFESSGMQEYLRKLKPSRIEDLIAMNALYRPGPMQMIDDFIYRKYGRKKIEYLHPALEPILKETYGIIVYQEQVMRIVSDMAGFSLAQADSMRRAMGKKKKEDMLAQKKDFVEGCKKNNIDPQIANDIANLIEKFAEYGFNKSHSAAYAVIAYQTAYLKAHYPAEFMAANLTSEVNNSDRVVILMDECKKLGLKIKPPDVNYSEAHFKPISKNEIAFGMAAIKNVGSNAIASIVEARNTVGKFNTIFDLMLHVDLRLVNKKVLESLIQAGAMDSLQGNRAQLFNAIETVLEYAQHYHGHVNRNRHQRSIFELHKETEQSVQTLSYPDLPEIPDWHVNEKLKKEKELLGYYISGHPLDRFRHIIQLYATDLEKIKNDENNNENGLKQSIRIGGLITEVRTLFDKKSNKMAFIKIEDFNRVYEAVVFGSVFPQYEKIIKPDTAVMITGRLNSDLDDNIIKIIANQIYTLEQVPLELTDSILLSIDREKLNEKLLNNLKTTLRGHTGNAKIYFELKSNGEKGQIMHARQLKAKINYTIVNQLGKIIGFDNLRVKVKKE